MWVSLLAFTLAYAIYEEDTPVEMLTKANFDKDVLRSPAPWIVEFYAPWCGHCKALKDDWETLARGMGSVVRVGAVDATEQGEIAGSYGIHGYPSILFFGQDKASPKRYESAREAADIAKFCIDEVEYMVNRRLQVKVPNKKKKKASVDKKQDDQAQCGAPGGERDTKAYAEATRDVDESDVVVLTQSNWDSEVLSSNDMWFVEFYAPWCGHCQQLAGTWARAATALKGEVKVGKCDSDDHRYLANKYDIKSYPTLVFFSPSDKNVHEVYEGDRSQRGLIDGALEKKKDYTTDFLIPEITSESVLTNACDKKKKLCIIALLDDERFLQVLKPAMKKYATRRMEFLWAVEGDHPALEKELNAKGPTLIALRMDKTEYFVMSGEFTDKNVMDFVNGVQMHKYFFLDYGKLPKIETIKDN